MRQKKSGQLLIEAIVAISIIVVGLLSVVRLLSDATAYSRVVTDQYRAVYLASEGIEVVRSIADKNIVDTQNGNITPWNQGLGSCASGCEVEYDSNSLRSLSGNPLRVNGTVYDYSGSVVTPFRRTITINLIGGFAMAVRSQVTWTGRNNASFAVDLRDTFYNWR